MAWAAAEQGRRRRAGPAAAPCASVGPPGPASDHIFARPSARPGAQKRTGTAPLGHRSREFVEGQEISFLFRAILYSLTKFVNNLLIS